MRIKSAILTVLALSTYLSASDTYLLKTVILRGTLSEKYSSIEALAFFDRTRHPEIFSTLDDLNFQDEDAVVSLADTLMNVLKLKSVDIFHTFTGNISGSGRLLREPFVVIPGWAFNLEIKPMPASVDNRGFHISLKGLEVIDSGKSEKQTPENLLGAAYRILEVPASRRSMPQLLDTDISIKFGKPVFLNALYKDNTLFILAFYLQANQSKSVTVLPPGQKTRGAHSLREVLPHYPYDLREKGIEGTIKLRVDIDRSGNLIGIQLRKSLHPFLDQSSIMAVKQWVFAPALEEGKAVDGQIDIEFNFDRQAWLRLESYPEEQKVLPSETPEQQRILDQVLQRGAVYSEKLAAAAYDFVCEETINETIYPTWVNRLAAAPKTGEIVQDMGIQNISGLPMRVIQGSMRSGAAIPRVLEKREYRSDFQHVRKNNALSVRRLPSSVESLNAGPPEEARYASIEPFTLVQNLLSPTRQHLFYYLIRDEETMKGRKTFVIEVLPKSGFEAGIKSARIWLEKETGKVIKTETESVYLEGFEDIVAETTRVAILPEFRTSYIFQTEKSGFLFPSQLEVLIYYPPLQSMAKKNRKMDLRIKYDKYKFFEVETNEKIKAAGFLHSP